MLTLSLGISSKLFKSATLPALLSTSEVIVSNKDGLAWMCGGKFRVLKALERSKKYNFRCIDLAVPLIAFH